MNIDARYVERSLGRVLSSASERFAAVVVTGPRQSGKTTLVKRHFSTSHSYCSLDDPLIQDQATSDPILLLDRFEFPVILDEIQHAPGLLNAVKMSIDADRDRKGTFIITGSQTFSLMHGVSESLAGRSAVLSLQSFSLREMLDRPELLVPWRSTTGSRPGTSNQMADMILRGGYPEPALDREMDPQLWFASYVRTYLERDVRSLRAVGDLGDFQRFIMTMATRSTGLVNLSEISRDLGVTAKTVRAWITVMEASSLLYVLKPYHVSLGKRLVKRPKIFFLDTGILCYLLGLDHARLILQGMASGPVFESAVFGQLYRLFANQGTPARIYFWRTAAGHEVDFVVESGGMLIPVEAKLTATPSPRDARSIERFQHVFGKKAGHGFVVCLCEERYPLSRRVDALPLGSF